MKIEIKKIKNKFLFTLNNDLIFVGISITKKFREIRSLYKETQLISETRLMFQLPFRFLHKIKYYDNKESFKLIDMRYHNILRPKHICIINNVTYEIIPHKGMKTSIFKNGRQIGFYEDKKVEFLGNQTIVLIVDNDIEKELICTFILAIKCDFKNDYSTISIDVGNLGPEARVFDHTWKPNDYKRKSL